MVGKAFHGNGLNNSIVSGVQDSRARFDVSNLYDIRVVSHQLNDEAVDSLH